MHTLLVGFTVGAFGDGTNGRLLFLCIMMVEMEAREKLAIFLLSDSLCCGLGLRCMETFCKGTVVKWSIQTAYFCADFDISFCGIKREDNIIDRKSV